VLLGPPVHHSTVRLWQVSRCRFLASLQCKQKACTVAQYSRGAVAAGDAVTFCVGHTSSALHKPSDVHLSDYGWCMFLPVHSRSACLLARPFHFAFASVFLGAVGSVGLYPFTVDACFLYCALVNCNAFSLYRLIAFFTRLALGSFGDSSSDLSNLKG
jgi:hypothetical protein